LPSIDSTVTVTDPSLGETASGPEVVRLLAAPRFEVMPARCIEEEVARLPRGSAVSVTASPAQGIEATLELSARLSALGLRVTAHLAAHLVAGRVHLEDIAARLAADGVREVFVIGGDASPVEGAYRDAAAVLDDLRLLPHSLERIGIAGHPEGHPQVSDERLLEALLRKQPLADYIVTQLCFEADVLVRWIRRIRAAGIDLPVLIGVPGVIERRRLLAICERTGVGASRASLAEGDDETGSSATRDYDPTPLAQALAGHADDERLRIEGLHLFTFNRVAATWAWARSVASR
jgi:methylenetetrahydrofolate reductase (NADPH)